MAQARGAASQLALTAVAALCRNRKTLRRKKQNLKADDEDVEQIEQN